MTGKRKEATKTELGQRLAYELYIKTIRHKENDRGKARMSRTSPVTLDVSKRFFFPRLLKPTVRQPVSPSGPLCS